MNIDELREYCLNKPGTDFAFPFDQETIVFRVKEKMFALSNINDVSFSVNLKCDPGLALDLRAEYSGIKPGFHMNKTHWNTVSQDGSVDDDLLHRLIDHSYDMVVQKLPKKVREQI